MHGVCTYSKLSVGNATMLGLKLKNGLLMEIISEILRLSHIWLSLRRLSHIWLILTIGVNKPSKGFDLFKIDAEGSEVDVLSRIRATAYETSDFILEISTEESRREFWELKLSREFSAYSQKNSWQEVKEIHELPMSHREGSVFISCQRPWFF